MKISLLGTGLLGSAIAQRLKLTKHIVTVWNRTRDGAGPLARIGMSIADTPARAVTKSDYIILTLSDADAIESVLFATENTEKLREKTVIQMGTIAPAESRAIAARMKELGGSYLEAPVLGSIPEVE